MATSTPPFKFGSHLPLLMAAVRLTHGPVLEMGMGSNSSQVLHWMCATKKRHLVSYESQPEYFRMCRAYETDWHHVYCIDNWNKADIEKEWDVALIDHHPSWRRVKDIARLAKYVKYLVVHDTAGRSERHYHYSTIFHLFKWQYNYDLYFPKTSVFSNFVDVTDFEKYL